MSVSHFRQWFLPEDNLLPSHVGTFGNVWGHSGLTQLEEGMLLALNERTPEMLLISCNAQGVDLKSSCAEVRIAA